MAVGAQAAVQLVRLGPASVRSSASVTGHLLPAGPTGCADEGISAMWMLAPRALAAPAHQLAVLDLLVQVSMACSSVSGVGGQPGAYTSTGTTWSTPWTSA